MMKKVPTPALMFIAAFSSATGTGLLERWIGWFSGYPLAPSAVFTGMMLSAFIAAAVVAVMRTDL